jgi:ornithine cyclodeaminase/alanine dehydrogenase-like protein (mu-crystallin family)
MTARSGIIGCGGMANTHLEGLSMIQAAPWRGFGDI